MLVLIILQILNAVQAQSGQCPSGQERVICNATATSGAWVSNVMQRRLTPVDDMARREISWEPDPEEAVYVVVTRQLEPSVSDFIVSDNITSDVFDLGNLDFDTCYQVFVCYAEDSLDFDEENPAFVPECGFCRTCFRTPSESIIITSVTVEETSEGSTYRCCASGDPLPIELTWNAVNNNGRRVSISTNTDGIEILTDDIAVEGDACGTLIISSSANLDNPMCEATNGNGEMDANGNFDAVVPLTEEEDSEVVMTTAMTTQINQINNNIASVSFPVFVIVLLAVLPLFVAPCIIVVSILCYRRWNKRYLATQEKDLETPPSLKDQKPRPSVSLLRERLDESETILPSDLNISVVIGQGEFGVIYKAYLTRRGNSQVVAVKTLKGIFATASDIEKATEEILKMSHFNHINVMSLIGVCMAPSDQESATLGPSIVMPFMAKGSLLDYLRKESDNLIAKTEDEVLAVRKSLLQMCLQVARGMEYLAGLKFIHRDLAARNCLMDAEGTIKVSDFGLTENVYSRNYFRQARDGAKLPLKWMALESIKMGIFTEKTDVWSYGVTCWEIFSGGAIPYPGIHPQEILNLIEEGKRLSKPKNEACCPDMYKLIKSCWDVECELRPTFSQIVSTLERYLEITSDYIDLEGIKVENTEAEKQAIEKSEVLQNRIPALPNDYCIAALSS